jgi:ATP-binding protein involved in chromosome partitioning
LTLSQKVPVTGAIIVTTPQDIALIDAKKAIEMFTKVEVPVLGIVENMAVYICSECGHQEHLFGAEGGARMADQYGVPLLGALPLDLSIRENADAGTPTVASQPESQIAGLYGDIATDVIAALQAVDEISASLPTITIKND